MHWDDLRFFLAIARTGQMTKAASRLGVDATTVGRRIRRLEQALEATLFEQTREGQVLSEAGEALLAKAEEMERFASAIDNGSGKIRATSGLVRVSASEGFGTWYIAHHLKSFLGSFPEVQVDLVASSGFLSPSKRETDVAILLARPRRGPLVSRKLADYGLRLYGSHSYLERHAPPASPADLRSHQLVGYIPDLIYAPELRYLDEVAPGLVLRARSSSINAQYRLIASGAGIGVLPYFIGDAASDVLPVLPEVRISRSFWLVTHQDTRRLSRIKAFVDWLSDMVAAHRSRLIGNG
jgi:DNA-binding transcriptional LysR family regulator